MFQLFFVFVLKASGVQNKLNPIDFHFMNKTLLIFFKISSFVFHTERKSYRFGKSRKINWFSYIFCIYNIDTYFPLTVHYASGTRSTLSKCACVFHSLRYGTSQCVACIPWQTKFPLCSSQHLPLLFLYFFHWKARYAFYLSDLKINIQHELILWIMSLLRYSCSNACILWCTSPLAFLLLSLFLFKIKLSHSCLSCTC